MSMDWIWIIRIFIRISQTRLTRVSLPKFQMDERNATPLPNLIHEPPSLPNSPHRKRTKVIDPSPQAIPGKHLTKLKATSPDEVFRERTRDSDNGAADELPRSDFCQGGSSPAIADSDSVQAGQSSDPRQRFRCRLRPVQC